MLREGASRREGQAVDAQSQMCRDCSSRLAGRMSHTRESVAEWRWRRPWGQLVFHSPAAAVVCAWSLRSRTQQ
jgi:hypothetical protein